MTIEPEFSGLQWQAFVKELRPLEWTVNLTFFRFADCVVFHKKQIGCGQWRSIVRGSYRLRINTLSRKNEQQIRTESRYVITDLMWWPQFLFSARPLWNCIRHLCHLVIHLLDRICSTLCWCQLTIIEVRVCVGTTVICRRVKHNL